MNAPNIYREFDQQTLDREYRIRDSVPVALFEAILQRYADESAAARAGLDCASDMAYGDGPDEIMDIFPGPGGAPLLVFIHGGYWRNLSHRDSSFMAPNMVAHGAAFAAVNYSLAPAASLDEIVRQCRAALAWLHRNARDHGADPDRIHIAGNSAGGHLVGMLLAGGWHDRFGVPDDIVKSACAISGLYDLEPIRLSETNAWIGLDHVSARRNSPIHHLPDRGCPLIVSHGGNETAEFKRQTRDYAAAWASRGFECEFIDRSAFNHFDIPFDLNDPEGALAAAVLAQMARPGQT
jgi:arylformamidase